MTTNDHDVAIVGAGPVGVVLAQLLARAGVRTLLVDREPDVLRIPRAIALDDDGSRVLQAIFVLAAAERTMPRIERVRMRSPRVGDLFVFDANRWRNGHPMLRMFHQPELEDRLREPLDSLATLRFLRGTTLESLSERGPLVHLTLRDAQGVVAHRARYVVGCDGARSSVRRMIGVEMHGSTYERDWLVVDVRNDPTPNREVHFLCDPARPGVTMPAPHGGRRWEFMLGERDDRATIGSHESLRRLLAPWGRLEAMELERSAVYTFHARVATHLRRGRVFLAGDAAHLTPPFAGQGLMAGLRDAMNLAWKLTSVIAGHAGEALLETYEVERLPNAHTMVDLARLMGEVIMARDELRCVVRDRVIAPLGRLPLLREPLSSVELKPATAIDAGLLRHGSVGSLRAGTLLPQVSCVDATGTVMRLDDRIGYRFAVLGLGVDPSAHLRRDQQAFVEEIGRTLAVMPCAPPSGLDGAVVDLEGSLAGAAPIGTCLVVRPDRHLYAVVPSDALERAVDRLRHELVRPRLARPIRLRDLVPVQGATT